MEELEIKVIGECKDGFEGLKFIQEHKLELVFLDIQMPKITGFEMLELLDNPPHIIFMTAFDQYALKAFEVNAVDYLLKPVNEERLQQALKKVLEKKDRNHIPKSVTKELAITQEKLQRIVVKTNGEIKIISLEEVYYMEAANDYVKIYDSKKATLNIKQGVNMIRKYLIISLGFTGRTS